jgi:hypothetical protein
MEPIFSFETLVLTHDIISQQNPEGNNILINFVCRVANLRWHVAFMEQNSLHSVQIVSGTHTASCPVGTGAPIPRSKLVVAWGWQD